MKRKIQAVIISFLVAVAAHAVPAPGGQTQKPLAGIEKLAAFLGHWHATGELNDAAAGKSATKLTSDFTCDWAANHGFLICDQIVHAPDGDHNDLSIYTYGEKDHTFLFFGITRGSKEARTTNLTIEGNLWTYSSTETNAGKQTQYRTTNRFASASKVDWRAEYSNDGEHWTMTAEGSDVRGN